MITDPPALSIYVFGAAYGESIVLHLPDGGWGVVDSCSRSQDGITTNPVVEFLRKRDVKVLEFLCLTHPHADHYKGMGMLMDGFVIKHFWPPNVKSLKHLIRYVEIDAQESGDAEQAAQATELIRIYRKVAKIREHRARSRVDALPFIKYPSSTKSLYPVPYDPAAPLRITALAPSDDQTSMYGDGLARCFNTDGSLRSKFRDGEHNRISSALLIAFGESRIILGGDVEEAGWRDALKEFKPEDLSAHAVKVSHHGSKTGYCPDLWQVFSRDRKPIAVVTCFSSKGLPRKEGLEEILPNVGRFLTTCVDALSSDQLPDGLDRDHLKSELALQAKMPGFRRANAYKHGVCGLHFDNRGNCLGIDLTPPAAEIPFRSQASR